MTSKWLEQQEQLPQQQSHFPYEDDLALRDTSAKQDNSPRASSATWAHSCFSHLRCSERADPLLRNLIRFSSFQKTVFISHMWLMAVLLTETELWLHDTLTDVTLLNHFFSILHEEHKNTAAITHTAAQLEQECELMSRSDQVNEGWRWSAEGWN